MQIRLHGSGRTSCHETVGWSDALGGKKASPLGKLIAVARLTAEQRTHLVVDADRGAAGQGKVRNLLWAAEPAHQRRVHGGH